MIFNTTTPAGNAGGGYEEVTLTGSAGLDSLDLFYMDEQGNYQHYSMEDCTSDNMILIKVYSPSVFAVKAVNSEAETAGTRYFNGGVCVSSSVEYAGKRISTLAVCHI